MKRKICFITGTRAEYGLLVNLIKKVHLDSETNLQIIATCMHMSSEFGLTYKEIENDGFNIDHKIEILLSSDSQNGICKSMGLALISLPDAYTQLKPDLIVLLGDRFEAFCAAAAANVCRIPVAHIHGGESTQGVIDEAFRHSITKMSLLHFTSSEEYRKRVIQLGENPKNVFNVGAIGIDNIHAMRLLNKSQFESKTGINIEKKTALVTFHPVTLDNNSAKYQFQNLLDAFDNVAAFDNIIFTKSNADTEGRIINRMIDEYVRKNKKKSHAFISMGQLLYLSAAKYADIVIGNSSSGIIEVPSLMTPSVNIGDRQKGRIKAESVIDCKPEKNDIIRAIKKGLSKSFCLNKNLYKNPYEKKNTANEIFKIIKFAKVKNKQKKMFYDIA